MKLVNQLLVLFTLCIITCEISSCSKEENKKPDTEQPVPEPEPTPEPEPEPAPDDFKLQGSMQAAQQLVGKDYKEIHKYMRSYGWDYSEHPN